MENETLASFEVHAAGILGEPETITAERTGDRDLAFEGWTLAEQRDGGPGEQTHNWSWSVRIHVYLTTSGQLVAWRRRWGQEYHPSRETWDYDESHQGATATVLPLEPTALLDWLRDGERKLGSAEKSVWGKVCRSYPPFANEQREWLS